MELLPVQQENLQEILSLHSMHDIMIPDHLVLILISHCIRDSFF